MKKQKQINISKTNEVVIFQAKNGAVKFNSDFKHETIWATQADIVNLYNKDQSVISRHIKGILKDREVDSKSNMQKMHIANSDKLVAYYSLDIILAVGYRTNSKRAIEFRQWATKVLRQHIIDGYTVNQHRLLQEKENFEKLQTTIAFLQEKSRAKTLKGQESEILSLLADYSRTLTFLEQYDKSKLKKAQTGKAKFVLEYEVCQNIVTEVKKELMVKKEAAEIFGNERGGAFESVIRNLYQTFAKKELYPDLETKAAHLLYLVIKDHPFSDGNKRIGSFLFVYFLDKNRYLYDAKGEKKINDNALTALALLVAESHPKEKNVMITLITNLLNK